METPHTNQIQEKIVNLKISETQALKLITALRLSMWIHDWCEMMEFSLTSTADTQGLRWKYRLKEIMDNVRSAAGIKDDQCIPYDGDWVLPRLDAIISKECKINMFKSEMEDMDRLKREEPETWHLAEMEIAKMRYEVGMEMGSFRKNGGQNEDLSSE
jgi:hypothetical protein